MRTRKVSWLVFVLVSMVLAGLALALTSVRDDAGDTLRQTSEGEGNPAPPTVDATNRTWVRDENGRGTGVIEITEDTWTALSAVGIGHYRWFELSVVDDTASETAILTVWGKDANGIIRPMAHADTLADAKSVSLAVGTERIGSGDYSAAVRIGVGPNTHIYVQEKTAPAAGTYKYYIGGF